MVCINRQKQNGGGVLDSIMKQFTYEKYKGERHAYSLAPTTFGTPMSLWDQTVIFPDA